MKIELGTDILLLNNFFKAGFQIYRNGGLYRDNDGSAVISVIYKTTVSLDYGKLRFLRNVHGVRGHEPREQNRVKFSIHSANQIPSAAGLWVLCLAYKYPPTS